MKRPYEHSRVKQSVIKRIVIIDNFREGQELRNLLMNDKHVIPTLYDLDEESFRQAVLTEKANLIVMEIDTGVDKHNPRETFFGVYLLAKYKAVLLKNQCKIVILTHQSLQHSHEICLRALDEAKSAGLISLVLNKPANNEIVEQIRVLCGLPKKKTEQPLVLKQKQAPPVASMPTTTEQSPEIANAEPQEIPPVNEQTPETATAEPQEIIPVNEQTLPEPVIEQKPLISGTFGRYG